MPEITEEKNTQPVQTGKLLDVDLEKEMRESFLAYSMSVLVERALPDVRDGLKPVHRRILYTMHENGLTPDKAYRKCADTVGAVLGRYHPHGDASVYDAMVRLAQDFSMRYPLVDGHGNFGDMDGHSAAAYRYTEARMNKMTQDMLVNIDKDTVDFMRNYDDRLDEPTVLPARFPNLLVNGSVGIAVGMATNIPPHNLREVVDAVCYLIDNPDAELPELMEYIKGPDFPTGGIIMGYSGMRAAYATGRGHIIVRAKTEIEEHGNDQYRIVVTEVPYQVNKLNLVKSIIQLAEEKRIEGIRDVVDYTSREGIKIVIDLKRDANPQVVLNKLFSYTQMQVTFGAILLCLVDGVPRVLTLKQMLEEYIKFQCEVVIRRTRYELNKALEKAHIWEALKIAVDNIDEVISIIRKSKDQNEAKSKLQERFGFDDVQADAIVKMRLGQLSNLGIQEIEDELAKLKETIADLQDILSNDFRVKSIVKEECNKMRDKYGDDRRTAISQVSGEVDIEDLIPEEQSVLTLTRCGYIKRQAASEYTTQKRGGRGRKGVATKDEDIIDTMFLCSSHDYVMFFTTRGRVYRLKCYEVPEGGYYSRGMNIVNLLPLEPEEKVTAMICTREFGEDCYLSMLTRRGIIKRVLLSRFANVRKNGLIAINLDENDELRFVRVSDGGQDLLVATRKGKAIRFNESDARELGRTARGVKALKLAEDDEVIDLLVCEEGTDVLTITATGYGRRSSQNCYRRQSRGGKGLTNYRVEKYGEVVANLPVTEDHDLLMVASDGVIIRVHAGDIRLCNRPAKGVRVMNLAEGASIVSVERVEREEGEEVVKPEDDGSADEGGLTEEELATAEGADEEVVDDENEEETTEE